MKMSNTQLWSYQKIAPIGVRVDGAFLKDAGVCVGQDILSN